MILFILKPTKSLVTNKTVTLAIIPISWTAPITTCVKVNANITCPVLPIWCSIPMKMSAIGQKTWKVASIIHRLHPPSKASHRYLQSQSSKLLQIIKYSMNAYDIQKTLPIISFSILIL